MRRVTAGAKIFQQRSKQSELSEKFSATKLAKQEQSFPLAEFFICDEASAAMQKKIGKKQSFGHKVIKVGRKYSAIGRKLTKSGRKHRLNGRKRHPSGRKTKTSR